MKLSMKSMAITLGLLWGGTIFVVGVANLIWPGYGQAFLDVMSSIYPGYDAAAGGFGQVIIGTLYGVLDAVVGGIVFVWLYNRFAAA